MTQMQRMARLLPPLMQVRRMDGSNPPKVQSQVARKDKYKYFLTAETQRKKRMSRLGLDCGGMSIFM